MLKDFGDNMSVFAMIFTLFGIYLIIAKILQKKDRRDTVKLYLNSPYLRNHYRTSSNHTCALIYFLLVSQHS